jgi:glutaredoxin 3
MLHLYYKPTCPYCQRVLGANEAIQAPLTLLNVSADPAVAAALVARGGKSQVPYLEDTDRNVAMYESLDIITYLTQHYGSGAPVTVPAVGNVCPIE